MRTLMLLRNFAAPQVLANECPEIPRSFSRFMPINIMSHLNALVKQMRDYLMGEPHALKPSQMTNTPLINPALMQEVFAQLVVAHPDKQSQIRQRLLALQAPVDASKQATCTQTVLQNVAPPAHVSGAAAPSEPAKPEEALFAGASHCTPKHRRVPRRAQDVPVGEWVAIAIAGAFILFIVIALVFLFKPERPTSTEMPAGK
jgi:hypothetical protein